MAQRGVRNAAMDAVISRQTIIIPQDTKENW
jgi:hypothetical protein